MCTTELQNVNSFKSRLFWRLNWTKLVKRILLENNFWPPNQIKLFMPINPSYCVQIFPPKRLDFAKMHVLPNFYPILPTFLHGYIYPSYPWHFATLVYYTCVLNTHIGFTSLCLFVEHTYKFFTKICQGGEKIIAKDSFNLFHFIIWISFTLSFGFVSIYHFYFFLLLSLPPILVGVAELIRSAHFCFEPPCFAKPSKYQRDFSISFIYFHFITFHFIFFRNSIKHLQRNFQELSYLLSFFPHCTFFQNSYR